MAQAKGKVVFVSAYHDYRTKKRASVQQVAVALSNLGYDIWFVSTRYSLLSHLTGDSRLDLDDRANRIETVGGVHCYLWKTPFHPFAARNRLLNAAMGWLFAPYAAWPNRTFDRVVADADIVIIEASVAAILIRRIRRLNPGARIIYYATDRLDTVGAHPAVRRRLVADADLVDHIALRSPRMAPDFAWAADKLYRAEFAVNASDFEDVGESPYDAPVNAVSVGSMLFDPAFFQFVAPQFPHVAFHVIGCGTRFEAPPNVQVHEEMPFRDTLPFIKHAAVGLAPYRPAPGVDYLADTSLKLAQYEAFGVPAVCPDFAVGNRASRAGYTPGDPASMRGAFARALAMTGAVPRRRFPTWEEAAARIVDPAKYPETRIA